MTRSRTMNFETLRDQLCALEVPDGNARRLLWVVPERLGAAMATNGVYEIFVAGPELFATQPIVARNLQHDLWEPSDGGPSFAATRVLLGSATHFAAVAALIVTELARLDLSTHASVQTAFNDVEPIIELAIRRGTLSTESLIGLIAELQVLRVSLLATPVPKRPAALLTWRGWTKGRDFVIGRHALEVKATLGTTSRHAFSGLHQIEAQNLPDGEREEVHLLSFGLTEVDQGGQSLPALVDDIASLLNDPGSGACAQFLGMIRQYGGVGATGYDHSTMSDWAAYQVQYQVTFTRLYAMDDPEMRLLTSAAIEGTFVVPGSMSFELQLPPRISAFNPAQNWQVEVAAMLAE